MEITGKDDARTDIQCKSATKRRGKQKSKSEMRMFAGLNCLQIHLSS